jgi:hypothetical protein
VIKLTDHCQDEADNARAQAKDVRHASLSASSVIVQPEGKIRLEGGSDLDGEPLIVVVRETQYGLRVITVF